MVRSSGGNPKPRGTVISTKLLRNHGSVLRGANTPRAFSFSHKVPLARESMPHGMHTVNSPTDRRRTSRGSAPSAHGINMPRGR